MLQAGTVVTLSAHSYRLGAPMAASAYGLVWRADRLPAGPPVALKFVNRAQMDRAPLAQRQRWIDGASDEAAFLRQLAPWDGRHIVRLLDEGSMAGLPVLALELLEGDLGSWMARCRASAAPVDRARAWRWIAQVNQALAKVHQYGRRHLDVKPSNLLMAAAGSQLKLADFGTSRALADRAPHPYAGTPSWQAPEQLAGIGGATGANLGTDAAAALYATSAATDYFALGALLYYLVTGGRALRFCSEAAQARRANPAAGAPCTSAAITLHDDEAALFARGCGGDDEDCNGCGVSCSDDSGSGSGSGRSSSSSESGTGGGNGGGSEGGSGGSGSSESGRGSSGPALALLRALLHADPACRPPHGLAISRQLAAVDRAMSRPGAASRAGAGAGWSGP